MHYYAKERAKNLGAGLVLVFTALAICIPLSTSMFRKWSVLILIIIVGAGALVTVGIYANTEKVGQVSWDRHLRHHNLQSLIELTVQNRMPQGVDLNFITPANIELLRDEINRAIDEADWFTVKPIEEDSPGNFTITVRDNIVHLSVYDFNGKEITILPTRAEEY